MTARQAADSAALARVTELLDRSNERYTDWGMGPAVPFETLCEAITGADNPGSACICGEHR